MQPPAQGSAGRCRTRKGAGVVGFLAAFLVALATTAPAEAVLRGHGGPVRAIVEPADPSGKTLVTAGFDHSVIRWALDGETARTVLRAHDGPLSALAALPDGGVASAGDDGRIVIWGAEATEPVRVLAGHEGPISSLAVSPDGTLIASASWDRSVRVWRLTDGAEVQRFTGHQDNVNGVGFTPDGAAVVSAGYDATVRVWPLAAGRQAETITLPAALNGLRIAPDGEIVLAGTDGRLHLVSAGGTAVGAIEVLETPVTSIALSADGVRIAAAGLRGSVTILDRKTRKATATLVGPGLPVWSLAFSRSGKVLFTGGADRLVRRWDPATGKPIDPVVPEPREASAAAGAEERGAVVFRACRACHTLTPDDGNRAGPTLHKIFGRRIATAPGYEFSKALKQMDIVWTPETVAKLFEVGPSVYTPGTKMPEQTIGDPADRKALVDWLGRVTQ